jgi:hypothetical protein
MPFPLPAHLELVRHVLRMDVTRHLLQHRQEAGARSRFRAPPRHVQDHPLVDVRARVQVREGVCPGCAVVGEQVRQARAGPGEQGLGEDVGEQRRVVEIQSRRDREGG